MPPGVVGGVGLGLESDTSGSVLSPLGQATKAAGLREGALPGRSGQRVGSSTLSGQRVGSSTLMGGGDTAAADLGGHPMAATRTPSSEVRSAAGGDGGWGWGGHAPVEIYLIYFN